MAKKTAPPAPPFDKSDLPTSLRESAQQIWMAGLSAFAKAQAGGNKVFEALMKEGESLQNRTRQAARAPMDDVAQRASGTWDKLEQVFETRVAKALHTLGVPTQDDIHTLSRRVAELTEMVDRLQQSRSGTAGAGTAASRRKASVSASSIPTAAVKAKVAKTVGPKTTVKRSAPKAAKRKAAD